MFFSSKADRELKKIEKELKLYVSSDKAKLLALFNSSSEDMRKEIIKVHGNDTIGLTLLHSASKLGDLAAVKFLVQHKVDVNAVDGRNWGALDWAYDSKQYEVATFLSGENATMRGNHPDEM